MWWNFVVVIVILLVVWIYKRTKKPDKFPPGPPRVPIFGSLLFLRDDTLKPPCLFHVFKNLNEDYGPLVGFYVGNNPSVLVSDYNIVKDLFKKDELALRPPLLPNNEFRSGWKEMEQLHPELGPGLQPAPIFGIGQYQQEMRRFVLRNLRDFGFGKSSMEDRLNDQVAVLCKFYSKLAATNEIIKPNLTMNVPVVNSIWNIFTGETLDPEDPKSMELAELVDTLLRLTNPQDPILQILPHPSMANWPILRHYTAYETAQNAFKKMEAFVNPYIKEHQRTLDADNVRDFMDVWLLEVQKTTDPKSCFYGQLGIYGLLGATIDMFLAGMDTTSNTLTWSMFYMLWHPEHKKRVQDEIDQVIGPDRIPSLDDKESLHFVNACLLETFRASGLALAGVPHYTACDVPYQGYVIPKGTTVISGLYNIMHDPKHFKDPESFNPLRFIDEVGHYKPDERVIPFSVGKRYCMGQSLAEKEFYLFFVGIMQKFDFQPAPGSPLPGYRSDGFHPNSLLRFCPSYEVIVKKRD